MLFDAVLMEFEGVLADTAALRRDALVRSLAEDNIPITPLEYDAVCGGFPVRQGALTAIAVRSLQRDETAVDLIVLRAERYFAERAATGISLIPGARELIDQMAGAVRLGIVTRANRREVDMVLELGGLAPAFECIVTADDVTSPKPAPEAYERSLERLARRSPARPAATLALEDGPLGILSAHAVRLRCIAVGALPAYHAVTADAYVPSLAGHTLGTLTALVTHGEQWTP